MFTYFLGTEYFPVLVFLICGQAVYKLAPKGVLYIVYIISFTSLTELLMS